MKVPISWLKDYVDIDISIEELAERLTLAGLEVSSIEYIGIPQGEPPEGINLPPSNHLVWDRHADPYCFVSNPYHELFIRYARNRADTRIRA